MALSASCLLSVFVWKNELEQDGNGWIHTSLIVLAIFFCAVSILASTGTKIAVTKDWVVAISNHDKDLLAGLLKLNREYSIYPHNVQI